MSFTKSILYPANPNTTRGEYTKLSASKSRIVYANGKSIIVGVSMLKWARLDATVGSRH
jgi:hypothetical protein